MDEPGVERRLAAILAADVVGYSRLMAADERGTHARLKALRKELVDPAIARHRGRTVKLMGDGTLVEFPSVVEAVLCAAAIQRGMAERNADVPEDRRILLRIGVNLGDIIFDGGDIYGDGVNVAARLEGLAEPGGVCVSRTVYNHVKGKVDVGFEPRGEHWVKNIAEPVSVYRLLLDAGPAKALMAATARRVTRRSWRRWAVAAAAAVLMLASGAILTLSRWNSAPERAAFARNEPWDLPAEPSITVLPFANLSGDPEQEYFVDGITDDIITDLSKFSNLFVIAAHSSFRYKGQPVKVQEVARDLGVRYVLEGSVQRAGDTLRINAQLIDATTGRHVWAERYDRPAEDLFTVQREITRNLAGVLGSERGGLLQAELQRLGRSSSTESLAAYEFYLRGVLHDERETKEDNLIARQMFEKAAQIDLTYAKAIAEQSITHLQDIWGDWTETRQQSLSQAEDLARQAIEIDPSEPLGYLALGSVYQLQARNDQAIPLIEKAHALNPNDYHITYSLGFALAYSGSPERGVDLIKEAQRLNPYHPEGSLRDLAQAYFFARRYQDAIATLNMITQRHRTSYWLYLAASHAQLGQIDEARAAINEALRLNPELTLEHEIRRRLENGLAPANAEHLREALRKAGLPV